VSPEPRSTPTAGQGRSSRSDSGRIAGAVLQAIRSELGLTQVQLADALKVSVDVVQAWESGRRALSSLKIADLYRYCRNLRQMGADQHKLTLLTRAVEADLILGDITHETAPSTKDHPLATGVPDRLLTELLAWPLNGRPPRSLQGGPSTRTPLRPGERDEVAALLRAAADQADDDENGAMLRRQIKYLLAGHEKSLPWAQDMVRRDLRKIDHIDHWTPTWAVIRSIAVSETINGDTDFLAAFIRRGLETDEGKTANLNYWAYWTGEMNDRWTTDSQMLTTELQSWNGERLLDSLSDSLLHAPYRDLCAYTLWTLVVTKRHLLAHPERRERLTRNIERALSSGDCSDEARQKLEEVAFILRSLT
jgi:transcriptional regulator with XRE-family HTH domain